MFLLGILAFLQISFLPGSLALLLLRPRLSSIQFVSFSYFLSLLINYGLACILTITGAFVSQIFYFLILLELLGLFYLLRKHGNLRVELSFPYPSFSKWTDSELISNLATWVATVTGLVSLGYIANETFGNFGTILSFADEIGSYNSWAVQWATNRFPNPFDTMGYPVSQSANWAAGYLIIGNSTVQFFNRAATSLAPFCFVLLMLDRGYRDQNIAFPIGALFFSVLAFFYTPHFIGVGPLDLSVSCIIFSCFLLGSEFSKKTVDFGNLILLNLVAASAATLKQSGLISAHSWH